MWVVVALCTLIALTALVLSVPVDLGARVEVHGRPTAQFRVQWLFGRVSKTLRTGEGGAKPPKAAVARKTRRGGRARRSGRAIGRLGWDIVHVPGLLRSVARTLGRLIRCIQVRSLAVDFRADLGDPADTAMVVGVVSQAVMFADLWSPYSFRLMPAFEGEPLLDGEAELAVRVRPVSMIPPLFGFIFSSSTLKALVLVIRSRWKKDG